MKIALSFIAIFLFFISTSAQSQKISKNEYEKIFQFAVSETNADYPVILKVITNEIENGKTVRTETAVVENESAGRHRSKRTVLENGKEKIKYQINAGFGNVFCSDDGVKWEVTCSRKLTPTEWRESTKMRTGDSSNEEDFYRRADRWNSARV